MKKFLFKLTIFSIPLLLFVLPPLVVLKMSGENYTEIDAVLKSDKKYLIGYSFTEDNYNYVKWKTINLKPKKKILAIGSSRILQFRANMFNASFYNAGYTIRGISDFKPFIQSIPKEKLPKTILINIDQWMFNANWDMLKAATKKPSYWKESFEKNASFKNMVTVWKDIFKSKFSFFKVFKSSDSMETIGLNARVNEIGFRNDGSMLYGGQIKKLIGEDKTATDYHFTNTLSRIATGTNRFEFGSELNPKAIKKLNEFLNYCSSLKINVVAILPPFADDVNDALEKSGKHTYTKQLYSKLNPIFKKYNFELWEMSHLNTFFSNDLEMIDGFHASEVAYLKMLIYMVRHKSILSRYTNLSQLKMDLWNKSNRYTVYN